MNSLECLTARCLLGIYWLMGLLPFPARSQLVWLFLTLVIRGLWTTYFVIMLWNGLSYLWKADNLTIGYINGTALFLGYASLGLLLQLESAIKHETHARLQDLRFQSQLQMQRFRMSRRGGRRAVRLLLLIASQWASDMAKMWANGHANISPVIVISMPQMWLLRFRYVQLLEQVMGLNQRALQLRHSLLGLSAGTDIWQPYGLHEDRQLQTLRLSYERLFECYETFSDCYGWGMLGLQMMSGFEFVSNAYWIITEAYQAQQLYMLVYNGATCIAMGILITSLFWYGDASAENVSE